MTENNVTLKKGMYDLFVQSCYGIYIAIFRRGKKCCLKLFKLTFSKNCGTLETFINISSQTCQPITLHLKIYLPKTFMITSKEPCSSRFYILRHIKKELFKSLRVLVVKSAYFLPMNERSSLFCILLKNLPFSDHFI